VTRHRDKQVKTFHRTLDLAREAKGDRTGTNREAPRSRRPFDEYAREWVANCQGRTVRGFDDDTRKSYEAALDAWAKHLDAAGVQHSTVLTAIQAWVLVFEDPDGRRLRLYTLATHGPEIKPDANSPWLK